MREKVFYLWDFSGTTIIENWNERMSGFKNYEEYLISKGLNLGSLSPWEYETNWEEPYKRGFVDLELPKGFDEALEWTNDNYAFTTGNREQFDWRAPELLRKYKKDYRRHFKGIVSTFDYGESNAKGREMFEDIFSKKIEQGYTTVVYVDDNEANCILCLKAITSLGLKESDFGVRVYHMNMHGKQSEKKAENFYEISSLKQFIEQEKLARNVDRL